MKMKALLWSTLLQYCVLAIFEFHAISSKIELNHYAHYLPRERSCSSLLVLEGGKSQEKTSVSIYCLVALGKGVEVGGVVY